jgi:hypothetical protein
MPEYIVEYRERKTSFGWRPSSVSPIIAMNIQEATQQLIDSRWNNEYVDLFYRIKPKATEQPVYVGFEHIIPTPPPKEWRIIPNPDKQPSQ